MQIKNRTSLLTKKRLGSILIIIGMVLCVIFAIILLRFEYVRSINDLEYSLINDRLKSDIRYIEDIIGEGEWKMSDGNLYRGNIILGDGSIENANEAPFLEHTEKTSTFSYVFLRTNNDNELTWVGDEKSGYQQGHYLRVAGSTRSPEGLRIEGTYIEKSVADALDAYGEYNGIANVAGGLIYCRYETLNDSDGNIVGVIVVGRNITELQADTKKYTQAVANKTLGIIILSLILAVTYMVILMRSKIIKNHKLEDERIHKLSELIDEHMFQYDYSKDLLEFNDSVQTFSSDQVVKGYLEKMLKTYTDETDLENTLVPSLTETKSSIREINMKKTDGRMCWYRIITKIIFDDNGREHYAVGKIVNIQSEIENQAVLVDRAMRDGMTQLYNQSGFKAKVEESIQSSGVFFMIDVDSFKKINDTYGHSCGDQVLCGIASVLKNVLGQAAVIGRIGGDEFAAYIPELIDLGTLKATCENLLSGVSQINTILGMTEPVTLSMGVCLIRSGDSYRSLYTRADKMLYIKKRNGKNGYHIGD